MQCSRLSDPHTTTHFCLILPGIPEGGYDHWTCFTDEEVRVTPVVCAWPTLQAGAEQMWWQLLMVLICIPLGAGQVKERHMFLNIWRACPVKYLFMSRACFSLGLSACLFISELNFRFWRRAFVSKMLHYRLPVCSLRFHFFKLSFDEQKCLILMSDVSLISFVVLWFCFSHLFYLFWN